MTIEELSAILRPSAKPVEVPSDAQLDKAEVFLSLSLPKDYRLFIKTYGSGDIAEFLGIYNPIARAMHANLVEMPRINSADYFMMKRQFPNEHPFKYYPDPDGIFPYGSTDNGDVIYWLMHGRSDKWTTVVWDRGLHRYEMFSLGMLDFIGGLMNGNVQVKAFPPSVPFRDGRFRVDSSTSSDRFEKTNVADNW